MNCVSFLLPCDPAVTFAFRLYSSYFLITKITAKLTPAIRRRNKFLNLPNAGVDDFLSRVAHKTVKLQL